ncbi:MAG: AAA family ATPase [Alphaproteobacteria bacterium]|nr:AAA family ATPase [Alphaproteobacteria bacterium]
MNITNPPLDPHPRYADSLVGHAPVVEHLKAAHKAGRLPHGLLFTGEKGLGKATLAHQLARALLTDSMEYLGEKRPVPLTSTDHLLRAGNHPDFIVLEKAADEKGKMPKDISVEKARSVVHFFSQTSLEDNWRIAVIDSVDDLPSKGANTLLKVLEEPPHKCLLILISQNLESVLPTLRSRTQIIQFSALSEKETESLFEEKQMKDAPFLASVSAGRPGLGLMINDLGGRSFYEAFLNVMKDISVQDLRSTHAFIETFVLKNTELDPEIAWFSFADFLNHWVAHRVILEQKNKGQSLLSKRSPDQWVESWFSIQETLKTTHVFSLDKKQTLLCIFHELAGLHQR